MVPVEKYMRLVDLMAMNGTNCLMLSQQLLKAMNILFYEQVTLVSRTQSSGPLCLWQCFLWRGKGSYTILLFV